MKKKPMLWLSAVGVLILLLAGITAYMLIAFQLRIEESASSELDKGRTYEAYYVLITEEKDNLLWDSVYEGARQEAEKDSRAYVEVFDGELMSSDTVADKLSMAIDAGVDGIILDGAKAEEVKNLVKTAKEKEIPVVAALYDGACSYRECFVGVNNYNLGQEYAKQAQEIMESNPGDYRITVFLDHSMEDTGKNSFYQGLKENLNAWEDEKGRSARIQTISVDTGDAFRTEEAIRELLTDETKEQQILICLSEADTRRASEGVVDYNRVGDVKILGYYESDVILEAINKGIVYSTITIDGGDVGSLCVQALNEYRENGYVNQYFPVDIHVIKAR